MPDSIFDFSKAIEATQNGLAALVSAKAAEAVQRVERRNDMVADSVRGATVSPVNNASLPADPVNVSTGGGFDMQKGALIVGAVLLAGFLLRRL